MSRIREKGPVVMDGSERSPTQILETLRVNFDETYERKTGMGEPLEQIIRNWAAGVGGCFYFKMEEGSIPENTIEKARAFLTLCSSPEFDPTMDFVEGTYGLIDEVLGREPVEG